MVTPEDRAKVVRVAHALTFGAPDLDPPAYIAVPGGKLTSRDPAILSGGIGEDLALLNACLAVVRDLHERQFAALERLLTLAQWNDGLLDVRLRALSQRQSAQALTCLCELGWLGS